jgi:hypothetical protein
LGACSESIEPRRGIEKMTTETPKEECQRLLDVLLPFAAQVLSEHGEFFPFGATMSAAGEIEAAAGWTGDDKPPSAEIIGALEQAFRAGAKEGRYRATGLALDVRVAPPGQSDSCDAIACQLDHHDDYSIVVYYPYTRSESGELEVAPPFAGAGENAIFK